MSVLGVPRNGFIPPGFTGTGSTGFTAINPVTHNGTGGGIDFKMNSLPSSQGLPLTSTLTLAPIATTPLLQPPPPPEPLHKRPANFESAFRPGVKTELCVRVLYKGDPCTDSKCMHAHSIDELVPHPYGKDYKSEVCDDTCRDPFTCRKLHSSDSRSHWVQVFDDEVTGQDIQLLSQNEKKSVRLLMTVFPSPLNYIRVMLREAEPTSTLRVAQPLQRISTQTSMEKRSWWDPNAVETMHSLYAYGLPFRWKCLGGACAKCGNPYYQDTLQPSYVACYGPMCHFVCYAVPLPVWTGQPSSMYQQQQQQQVQDQQVQQPQQEQQQQNPLQLSQSVSLPMPLQQKPVHLQPQQQQTSPPSQQVQALDKRRRSKRKTHYQRINTQNAQPLLMSENF